MKLGQWHCRAARVLRVSSLLTALALPSAAISAQTTTAALSSISGQVLTATGTPAAGATVQLQSETAFPPRATQSDVNGQFTFRDVPAGHYKLHAAQAGADADASLTTTASTQAPTAPLTLKLATTANPAPAVEGMEFSDKPNFTVAGVTDWTAVGGHGADTTLRASEDLTRETLALKSHEANTPTTSEGAGNRSEAQLRAALAANPQSFAANRALGAYCLAIGDYAHSLAPLETAQKLNPTDAETAYDLARAYQSAARLADAREQIHTALALKDSATYHHLAAEIDEALGDPVAAVQQDERAAQLDPSEANFFTWGSELLLHRAVWQAAEVFAQGAKAHPHAARLQAAWGVALFSGALYEQSAQHLCAAADLDPTNPQPYRFMGKVTLASPSPQPCMQQRLARYAEQQPANAQANYLYAMSLLREDASKNSEHAEQLLRRAVSLDPKLSDAYVQLGILATTRKDTAQALALYTQAVAADPQNSEAHYRLAVLYDRTGHHDQARQEFAQHEVLQASQAQAVEKQREGIKQFLISTQTPPQPAPRP